MLFRGGGGGGGRGERFGGGRGEGGGGGGGGGRRTPLSSSGTITAKRPQTVSTYFFVSIVTDPLVCMTRRVPWVAVSCSVLTIINVQTLY